jgi:MerR family redox-sensitive transcriptional activator SoxR
MGVMPPPPVTQPTLSIGQVAAASGVEASAIRYYEAVGVLPRPPRSGGKRRYDPEAVDRLLLIRFCRRLGFRLSDLRHLLFDPQRDGAKQAWRRLIDARLTAVQAVIREAKAVERVLRESRDCDCVTLSSCRFLRQERLQPRPSSRRY